MELSTTTLSQIFSPQKIESEFEVVKQTGRFSEKEIEIIKHSKANPIRLASEIQLGTFVGELMKKAKVYAGFNTSFPDEPEMAKMIQKEIKERFSGFTHLEIFEFCKMGIAGELGGEINNFSPANIVRWGSAYTEIKRPVIGKYLIEEQKAEKEIDSRNKITQEDSDLRMKNWTLAELEKIKAKPGYKFPDYGNAVFNFLTGIGIQFNQETKNMHWKEAKGYYKLNGKKDFPDESRAYENFVKWCEKKEDLKEPNYFFTLSVSRSKQFCLMDYFKEVIEMDFDLQSLIESLLEEKLLKNNSTDNQEVEKNL